MISPKENISLKVLLSHEVLNSQLSLILFSFWYILILQQIPTYWSSLLLEDTYLSYNFQVHVHIMPLTLLKKFPCQRIIRRWRLRQEGALGSHPCDLLTYVWYLCF